MVQFAGISAERLVLNPAESLHRAVAARVFASLGPIAAPVRFLHDGISGAAYSALRTAGRGASGVTAKAIRRVAGDDLPALSRTQRGRAAISALNALAGDVLEDRSSGLAIQLAIRHNTADLELDALSLRRAFPRASSRLAVFLHGLGESEEHWLRSLEGGAPDRLPFAVRLHGELGFTPVLVRYNSGLHISDNGERLSRLLERVVAGWPVPIDEIALIGHSMGGLVARSAGHAAMASRMRWAGRLRHLIALGAPHTGVPLEKLVHTTALILRRVPESRPLADILDLRSPGIRDLRFGYVVEEDWRREQPGWLLDDRRGDTAAVPGCTYTFITASLTQDPRHPLSWLGGDLLVRTESAAGRRPDGSVAVSADSVVHLGALSHFDLLDHPLVYDRIRHAIVSGQPKPVAPAG